MGEAIFILAIPKPFDFNNISSSLGFDSREWKLHEEGGFKASNRKEFLGVSLAYSEWFSGANPRPDKWNGFLEISYRGSLAFFSRIMALQVALHLAEQYDGVFVGFEFYDQIAFHVREKRITFNSSLMALWPIHQLEKCFDVNTAKLNISENTPFPTFDD